MSATPTPRIVAAYVGMSRIQSRVIVLRQTEDRRAKLRRAGCTPILTRAELAKRAAR